MSPLLVGRAKIAAATEEIVRAQAEALDAALTAGGDQLDASQVAAGRSRERDDRVVAADPGPLDGLVDDATRDRHA